MTNKERVILIVFIAVTVVIAAYSLLFMLTHFALQGSDVAALICKSLFIAALFLMVNSLKNQMPGKGVIEVPSIVIFLSLLLLDYQMTIVAMIVGNFLSVNKKDNDKFAVLFTNLRFIDLYLIISRSIALLCAGLFWDFLRTPNLIADTRIAMFVPGVVFALIYVLARTFFMVVLDSDYPAFYINESKSLMETRDFDKPYGLERYFKGLQLSIIPMLVMLIVGYLLNWALQKSIVVFIISFALIILAIITWRLTELYRNQKWLYYETVIKIVDIMESKSFNKKSRAYQVRDCAEAIGKQMGLRRERLEVLKIAAVLLDIGNIGIEDNIINKRGSLNSFEFEDVKRHPLIGIKLLDKGQFHKSVFESILHHHERVDGKGYPDGLRSNDILLEARILAVADSFVAMTSIRPYRNAMSQETAEAILIDECNTKYDNSVVEAFIKCCRTGKIEI